MSYSSESATGNYDWRSVLGELSEKHDLTRDAASWAMRQVMEGAATNAQIAVFGMALQMKGVTPVELAALADVMVEFAVPAHSDTKCVDIVGTGGDRQGTVNISTMSSLVVAGAGVPVAKHGNRAASSKSGGADVLEQLGVAIDLNPSLAGRSLDELGITFCFAPVFHPALRFAGQARREIAVPTVFNVLGPLTNPLRPQRNLIGCAFEELTEKMAEVFRIRGADVLVVRGSDGLDEVTTTGSTSVVRVHGDDVEHVEIHPRDFGIPVAELDDLRGGDAKVNAEVARELLDGKKGPVRDAVLMNSAAAIVAFDNPALDKPLVDEMAAALDKAEQSIDSGAAHDLLQRWVEFGRSHRTQD